MYSIWHISVEGAFYLLVAHDPIFRLKHTYYSTQNMKYEQQQHRKKKIIKYFKRKLLRLIQIVRAPIFTIKSLKKKKMSNDKPTNWNFRWNKFSYYVCCDGCDLFTGDSNYVWLLREAGISKRKYFINLRSTRGEIEF